MWGFKIERVLVSSNDKKKIQKKRLFLGIFCSRPSVICSDDNDPLKRLFVQIFDRSNSKGFFFTLFSLLVRYFKICMFKDL